MLHGHFYHSCGSFHFQVILSIFSLKNKLIFANGFFCIVPESEGKLFLQYYIGVSLLKKIAVIGNRHDTEILDLLQKLLIQNNCHFLIGGIFSFKTSERDIEGLDFLVLDAASPKILSEFPVDLMVFKKDIGTACFKGCEDIARPPIAVIDPHVSDIVNWLKGKETTVITCGLSAHNTVTYSSLSEENPCITLLRKLRRADGSILEPQDIVAAVKVNAKREYEALAAVTAALICGIDKI
jgi:hypothetical protein